MTAWLPSVQRALVVATRSGLRGAIAVSLLVLVAVLCATSLVVLFTTDPTMRWDPAGFRGSAQLTALVWGVVGCFLIFQRPGLLVAWLLLGSAVSTAAIALAHEAVFRLHGSVLMPPGETLQLPAAELPWVTFMVWLRYWIGEPGAVVLPSLALSVFPDGPLRARRWRIALGAQVALGVAVILLTALAPWRHPTTGFSNPFAMDALAPVVPVLGSLTSLLLLASFALGVGSLIARFHGAEAMVRQQIKWITVAGALALALAIVGFIDGGRGIPGQSAVEGSLDIRGAISIANLVIGAFVIPSVIGIAILRYRLFDIDLVIERALVYGSVSAILAGAFAGLSTAAQYVLRSMTGQRSEIVSIALAVLATAAFAPLKSRVQAIVDRHLKENTHAPVVASRVATP